MIAAQLSDLFLFFSLSKSSTGLERALRWRPLELVDLIHRLPLALSATRRGIYDDDIIFGLLSAIEMPERPSLRGKRGREAGHYAACNRSTSFLQTVISSVGG